VLEGLALWLNVILSKIFATNIYYRLSSINILTINFALSAALCLIEKRTLLVYLTNSVKQSLYSAVNSCPSDSKVIPRTLSNFIALYDSHNSLSLLHIPSQVKSIHNLSSFLCKINSAFSPKLQLGLSNSLFLSGFTAKSTYVFIFTYMRTTYTTHHIRLYLTTQRVSGEQQKS
jgi:hypothetical protein